jgi:hypothetical protein
MTLHAAADHCAHGGVEDDQQIQIEGIPVH